jgi:hypothetical protein
MTLLITNMDIKRLIAPDEIALYDRQIRLWGLEAQNRCAASFCPPNQHQLTRQDPQCKHPPRVY